jgi:hypothetical protein
MSKRFTLLLFIVTFFSVTLKYQAQTVTLSFDTYGVTPYMVASSTTDIYDFTYTGLHNVGVGTKTFLIASIRGKKFTAPAYTVTRMPAGSKAAFGTTKEIQNDSTQVVYFTPDLPGTYNLTVTDGVYSTMVVINSAKYLGFQNSVVNGVDTKLTCNTCHSATVTSFQKTNHSTMFTRAMSATPGLSGPTDHYSANCVKCHTTGYDANTTAKNDGFDDLGFVYPTVITATTYSTLLTQFPDAMKRANIQCESCHGPASGHLGNTNDERISVTFSPDVCAYCHESGTNHIIAREFRTAIHAAPVNESGPGREACVQCHTGKGFQQFAEGVPTTDPYFDSQYYPITCAGCHDPHNPSSLYPTRDDAGNDAGHQLRKLTVTLLQANTTTPTSPTKMDVTGAGLGALCMNCHQSRTEANAAIAGAGTSSISSRFGPHHGPQGDILYGNNMLALGGVTLAKSNHFGATGDACVTCHMYNLNRIDGTGKLIESGGHTFGMSTYQKDAQGNYLRDATGARIPGDDNMEACAQCHGGTLGLSFDQAKFVYNKIKDLDNNGIEEGLQIEVKGMIAKIFAQMPKDPKTGLMATPSSSWTKTQLSAYWNALTAQEDRSNGVHNPKYVVTALWGAMKSLGINLPTSNEQFDSENIPTDYVVYQNYPNPFNPSTIIKFATPKESHVKLTIYDATGREVVTLIDDQLAAGTHNVSWNAKNLASGLYIYRIEAGNFVKANKMLLLK